MVDIESMLIALKNSNGANLKGELSHVIRQLQACSLTPGMRLDLFIREKKGQPYLNRHCQQVVEELTMSTFLFFSFCFLHRFC